MKVCILDDEKLALDNIKMVLNTFPDIEICFATSCAGDLLEQLPRLQPDVAFLDITLPDMNGIELTERIQKISPETKVVFVTAYDEYALEAFRVNAADYIMKPVTGTKIQHSLNKLFRYRVQGQSDSNFRMIGTQRDKFFIILPQSGQFIEHVNRELYLTADRQVYLLKHNIGYWEKNLEPYGWIRCHQSFLVNIDQIDSISPMFNSTYTLRLKDVDGEIPVSRTYVQEFKKKLNI